MINHDKYIQGSINILNIQMPASNVYYMRPKSINNKVLLLDESSNHAQYLFLKEDLIEHFDYEAVELEIWRYFKAWYECDFTLLRFIKRDKINTNRLYLDLYPEKAMGM